MPASGNYGASFSFSLSLSLSLCICLQQHTRLQSQPQLSLPFTYARTHALRESPATLARLLSFSLSLLSRVLSSRMRNNTNKKSSFRVPSESLCCFNTGVLLLLRYTASSTCKREREPDGFSSLVYLLRLLLLLLASLWSSVCFRLPTLAVGFTFFLLSLLEVTVVVGLSVPE